METSYISTKKDINYITIKNGDYPVFKLLKSQTYSVEKYKLEKTFLKIRQEFNKNKYINEDDFPRPIDLEISPLNPNQIYTETLEKEIEYSVLYLVLHGNNNFPLKLHPNRLRLSYFLFYRLNTSPKSVKHFHCGQENIYDFNVPIEHFNDHEYNDVENKTKLVSTVCWGNFISKCKNCKYEVYKNNEINCLACYYFQTVLNELHSVFTKKISI